MKIKKRTNGGKPVTLQQLKNILTSAFAKINKQFEQVNKQFEQIDNQFGQTRNRFDEIDRRFDVMETRLEIGDRRFIVLNARIEALEKTTNKLDKKFTDFITKMYNHIDTFIKKEQDNEREILFLGKQHDDLAKYCTQKIAYPTYGRNL